MFFIDIDAIINNVKERKAEKKRLKEVGAKFDKDGEEYKAFAKENASCIGFVEEKVQEINKFDTTGRETTTYAFTKDGPIIKKHIQEQVNDDGIIYDYDYTTYEGYIKPTGEKNAISGYVQIVTYHRQYTKKPNVYETLYNKDAKEVIIDHNYYEGVYKDSKGKIVEFDERQEGVEHTGKYGDVINHFEEEINKLQEKMATKQEEIQK